MNDEKLLKALKWAMKEPIAFILKCGHECEEFEILTDGDLEILEKLYDAQFEVNEKTPVNAKVLVRTTKHDEWIHRHFAHISPIGSEAEFICFTNGQTQWSSNGHKTAWEYCKLADTKGEF